MFDFDFNNAEVRGDLSELIPNGTVALMHLSIRPGGHGPDSILKSNREGNSLMLDCELTVVGGPYNKRKVWGNFVVQGETDGQKTAADITKSLLRSILESARGVKPADTSEAARRARQVSGYRDFDGITFCGKIGIERGQLLPGEPPNGERYADKNKLAAAITIDDRRYIPPGEAPAGASAGAGAASGGAAATTAAAGVTKPAWAS